MQNVVIDKPYRFVPPRDSFFWPAFVGLWLGRYLDRSHGISSVECRGAEKLKNSLAAGHGIILAPNHCRPCDPMVLGVLSQQVHRPFFVMASAHLFMQGGLTAWLLPRVGAFSVYREGMDREALKKAIEILREARRPLVIFPEGVISRTNDRLGNLQEGTAFIARSAAKQRAAGEPPGLVVAHAVAIRYFFDGDLKEALTPVLDEIERRLSWNSNSGFSLLERIKTVGGALLCLKEIEYLGGPQLGDIKSRLARLMDHLLVPLEKEWLNGQRDGDATARVKRLRIAILPDMVSGEITEEERARRWRQLADLYLVQQLSFYPPDYIQDPPVPERLLETVERFEEDLTDVARIHRPMRVVMQVGDAREVSPARDKSKLADPLMEKLKADLEAMLKELRRP